MAEIIINNCSYKTHPIYNLYAGSKDGRIIHIIKQKPHFGNKTYTGYLQITVRKFGESGKKNYRVNRFVYECYYGVIPNNGMQVDHKDDNKENDKLCNLQLLTPSENCKKSYSNRKSVKSINNETNEISYFYSMYSASQHLNICPNSIQDVCCGKQKSAQSKKDNCWYKFEYIKYDLPVNYIKSANIRPRRKTDEQIKERMKNYQNKKWTCPNCDKVYRNHYKYRHIKICK